MTCEIHIPVTSLLEITEAQTSVDFQGLRAASPQVDVVYDDFTLCRDNAPQTIAQAKVVTAVLCARFAREIRLVGWSPEEITFGIEVPENSIGAEQVEIFIREYLKSGLLEWWYASRNPNLAAQYAGLGATAAEWLSDRLQSWIGVRRLRYF